MLEAFEEIVCNHRFKGWQKLTSYVKQEKKYFALIETDSNRCSVSPLSILIGHFRRIHLAEARVECYIILNAWLIRKW